jgi:hypothetical protein
VQTNTAGFGECQRVTGQVDQDLPNTCWVTLNLQMLQAALGLELQLQATLAGTVLEYLDRTAQKLLQVEGDTFQL